MPVAIGLSADRVLVGTLIGLTTLCLVLLALALHLPRWCKTSVSRAGTIGLWNTCESKSIGNGSDGLCRRVGSQSFDDKVGALTSGSMALFQAVQGMAVASFIFTFLVLVAILLRFHVGVVVFAFVLQIVLITATIGTMAGACDNVHGVKSPKIDTSMGAAIGALFCVLAALAAQVYVLIRGKSSFSSPEPDATVMY